MQTYGFTTVLNSTNTIEIIGERAQLTAAPPLLLLLLCYMFLSRAQNTWPAACLAALACAGSCFNASPLVICEAGTAACAMYITWLSSGFLSILVCIAGLARDKDFRYIVRESLAAHAVSWCLFWMPARAGGYGLASTPRDSALLDMGLLESISGDFGDTDSKHTALTRTLVVVLQGVAAMTCVHTLSVSRETRFFPWITFGTLCIFLAYLTMLPGEDPDERTAFSSGGPYYCSLRAAPFCEHGVLGAPCVLETIRLAPLAVYIPIAAAAPRVLRYANRVSRIALAPVVLYATVTVASISSFLVLAIETGPSMTPDRREPHNGPCSPWGVYSTHLLVAAALALGVGPSLACFDDGSWSKPDGATRRVAMKMEKITVHDNGPYGGGMDL